MTQRYDTYKDSGVQWLGEIPGHWECVRVKNILKESQNVTVDGQEEQLSVTQAYGIIRSKDAKISNPPSSTLGWKIVKKNDIVFNKYKAHSGVFFASKYDGIVTFNYSVYNCFDNCHPKFYELLFHTNSCICEFKKLMRGVGDSISPLYTVQLYTIHIPLPPLPEQRAIVSYLDAKCGKIDEWVAQKQKEVELLGEMKQRVIADAVTRGLNPDVKMKTTNISWLPEVPDHWEIKPIRAILKESEEKSETGQEELLSLSQYTGVSYKKDAGKVGMFEAESTIGYKKLHPGQFVMNIMLAWNGSYAVSNLEGVISPAYCVFDFISDDDKMYYHYLWRTNAYQGAFKTESRGIIDSRLRLYPNKFLPFPTICPPLSEQRAIVTYINERTAKIDKMVENVNKEIEALKEYKQRLISDVVTGQIKVCE